MPNQKYKKASGMYNASEAALYLDLSKQMLKYYRLNGRIQGEGAGNNTFYTQEQLDAFDPTPEKPGPKPKKEEVKMASREESDQWHISGKESALPATALAMAS